MKINDKYRIVAINEKNVTVQERVVTEKDDGTSKVTYKIVGYYKEVKTALKYIVRKEINGTGLKNFHTVCSKIDELYDFIESLKNEEVEQLTLIDFEK